MRKTTDPNRKKLAPVAVTVLVIAYVVPFIALVLWAMGTLGSGERAVLPVLVCYLALGAAVIAGVLKALGQRLREIDGGEEEDASQY